MRAAHYDLPLMLAIIGGDPNRFKPYVDLYHRAFAQFGRPAREIGVHSHGYVAETDEKAREELWPDYKKMRDRIGAERGWPPMHARRIRPRSRSAARSMSARRKPWRAGSPPPRRRSAFRASTMKYSAGTLSHEKIMRCIELFGEKVMPLMREMMA